MRKTTLMAMGIVTALVSVADVDASAEWTSAPMTLDIESGTRDGAEGGDFTYDTLWFGVTNADYRILVNGVPLSTGSGVGTVAWHPQTVGDFVVTCQAFVDGMKVGDDLTASFRIVGRDLAGATITLGTEEAVYDGTPQTPPVKVVYQSETLVEGVDYTLDYENNVMPGVATVVIRGRGRFSDVVGKSFSIRPAGTSFLDLESGTRTADPVEPLAYDTAWFGDVADACGIFVDGRKLMSGTGVGTYDWASRVVGDHVLQYRSYIGDYLEDDSYRATFHVAGRDLVNATVTINEKTIRYDGTAHTPTLTLELDGKTLVPGVDYVLSYADNVNPGIGVITVTGLGSYVDILNVPFTIMPAGVCFLDIESGTRQAKNVEALYYDGAWNGNETGAVRMKILSQKSDAAGPTRLADNLSGTGHYDFTPDQEGVYTVSLNTYVDGFLSPEVYTATFNFSELVKPIPQAKITVTGYVGAYDGAGHSIAVAVDPSIAGATVRYGLTRDGDFGDKPLFTNVCAATTVWCEVSAAGYLPVTNSASVTITPRTGVEVTVMGCTAAYPYDGREKRAGGFDVAASDPLYTIDDFVFTGNSNAVRTAVGTTAFGMSAADFANVNPDFADVVFHVVDGSVTVTPGAVVNPFDPDDPSAPTSPGALSRADCVVAYDGEGHSVSVAPLLNPALAADGAAVTYSPDPSRVPFAPESPVFTNAVSTSVWYRIASPNYAPFTTNALLEIRPRPVTLTSKSATKVYDGIPLTAHEVAVGGDGFVDGAGATYAFTGEQTAVGTSGNTFTYTLTENTKADNYEITTVNGTLTVTKASIGGGEGSDEPGDGDVPDGGLSKFDTTAMYDGAGHTIDTNALVAAFGTAMVGESAVEYAAGGSQFTATVSDAINCVPPCFTNAGEYVVWYRVTNPNYEDFVHAAKVTISKRPVTLISGTKLDFVYDGQPHACPHFIKSGQDFVEGEGVTASNWATVTTVSEGEVANTFDYAAQEGTDLENYAVTVVTGQIAVVAAPIPVGPGGAITTVGYTNVYDGVAHGVAVSANGLLTTPTVQYRADEADAWGDTSPTFSDACDTQVWYRVSAPNYAPVVGSVGIRITPRPVTLTSRSATKVYDGTPLTAHEVTVGGDGFVDGEGATYTFTGSQTVVGTSENTFTYALNEHTVVGNYEITTVNGTLTVTKASIGGDEGGGDEPGGGEIPDGGVSKFDVAAVYDGAGHTVDTNGILGAFAAGSTCMYARAPDGRSTLREQAGTLGELRAAGTRGVVGNAATLLAPGEVELGDTEWSEVPPVYTNAGEYVVWYRVTNPNYADFVHAAKVTITPRPVTLTSGTKLDFVYDGQPHACPHFIKSGHDFVAGEGIVTSNWATVTRVDEGEVANTFDYAAQEGTDLANYEIAVVTGKIAVVRATYDMSAVAWDYADPFTYDGTVKRVALTGLPEGVTATYVDNEKTAAGTYLAKATLAYDMANYHTPAAVADCAWEIRKASVGPGDGTEPGTGDVPDGGFSKFDTTFVYDGEGHTVDTNTLVEAFVAVMGGGETRVDYGYAAAGAAATGQEQVANWREVAPVYTNAGEYVVWYRVTNPNYEDFVHAAKVTITKRLVTLTSADGTWVYDGAAHSNAAVTVSGDGFVPGEGMACCGFATITDEGACPNSFNSAFHAGTLAGNYEVATVFGTLTVTAAPPCHVILDALGGWVGSAVAATQAVRTVYGALPEATRSGYRFAGWFLGVTNGAPGAVAGGRIDVRRTTEYYLFGSGPIPDDTDFTSFQPDAEPYRRDTVDLAPTEIAGRRLHACIRSDLYQVGLGPRATWRVCDGLDAYGRVEALCSLAHLDFDTGTSRTGETKCLPGVGGTVGLAASIAENVALYAEAGYEWIDATETKLGRARAEVDFSGLVLGAGVVVSF